MKTLTGTLALLITSLTPLSAISLSSPDAFDTDSEGWQIGNVRNNGVEPTHVGDPSFDGQPGFLSHFSNGGGPNGKWLMWTDDAEWQGDYLAAGVSGISLWVDNRSGNPLDLRIALQGDGGFFYSDAQTVVDATGGDDWVKLFYSLDEAIFTHATSSAGTEVFADTLASVTRFEILGGPSTPSFKGAVGGFLQAGNSSNVLWIDNIAAVPEPSVLGLWGASLLVLVSFARRR